MKKVLIITYHFPPSAGAASQRILKFLKFLPKFNWQPSVLTVDKVDYPDLDNSLLEKIPKETIIYKTKYWTPFGIYRKITGRKSDDKIPVAFIKSDHKSISERISVFFRMNIFLPDAKIGWLPYAVKEGIKIVRQEKIDAIISSGPPHTCHLIARNIKRKTGVKWIADFRDPWTDIDYYSGIKRSAFALKLDSKLELSVLTEADTIISASKGYLNILKSKGAKNNYEVITNGFDLDDFKNIKKEKHQKFIISYTGNMPKTRNPINLWLALNELLSENENFKSKFEFWFAGVLDDEVNQEIKNIFPFINHFKNLGYVNHHKAIELVFNSNLLIMIVNQVKTNNEILPGKIFEYIATGNNILVIGPEEGESAKVIREVNQGIALDYSKKMEMKNYIQNAFDSWLNNSEQNNNVLENSKYNRELIIKRLVEVLEAVQKA